MHTQKLPAWWGELRKQTDHTGARKELTEAPFLISMLLDFSATSQRAELDFLHMALYAASAPTSELLGGQFRFRTQDFAVSVP